DSSNTLCLLVLRGPADALRQRIHRQFLIDTPLHDALNSLEVDAKRHWFGTDNESGSTLINLLLSFGLLLLVNARIVRSHHCVGFAVTFILGESLSERASEFYRRY